MVNITTVRWANIDQDQHTHTKLVGHIVLIFLIEHMVYSGPRHSTTTQMLHGAGIFTHKTQPFFG